MIKRNGHEQVSGSRSTSEETPLSTRQIMALRDVARDGWQQNRNDIRSGEYDEAEMLRLPVRNETIVP
jgi:hypothetical protein